MRRLGAQDGIAMLEIIIALGLLGIIGVAFLTGLGGAYRAQDINQEHVQGENLVRAVLEDIRFQPYLDDYTGVVTAPVPSGYSFAIVTQPYCTPEPCTTDNNLQKSTVAISRSGKPLLAISDLKARR